MERPRLQLMGRLLFLALPWFLLTAGLAIRVGHYLGNRSLWLDEVRLAQNILDRGPLDLLQPLDADQGAPVLFLQGVKVSTVLFGTSEFALRLIPLLASAIGLYLFVLVGRHCLDRKYVPVAVWMFAFSSPLVYYAYELKQYTVDVTIGLALSLSLLAPLASERFRRSHLMALAAGGGLAGYLSHASLFVVAAIGATLVLLCIRGTPGLSMRKLIPVFMSWAIGWGLNYTLFLRHLTRNDYLLSFWRSGFLPWPTSWDAVRAWYEAGRAFLTFAGYGEGWEIFLVAMAMAAAGAAVVRRSPDTLSLLLPFAFTLAASVLGVYPFSRRLILFLIPYLILPAVKGLQVLTDKRGALIALPLAFLLLLPTLDDVYKLTTRPITHAEVRRVLAYLDAHRQSGDQVYVYYGASPAVRYYRRDVAPASASFHYGADLRGDRPAFVRDIEAMGQWERVWFLFSHVYGDEEAFFLSHIDGVLADEKHIPGARLYLYRFEHAGAGASEESG